MLEKERVLAELKNRAKQYGLSAELLETLASSVSLEDEAKLKEWLDVQEPILAAMQKSIDSARGSKGKEDKDKPGGKSAEQLEQIIESKISALVDKYESKISELEERVSANAAKVTETEFQDRVKRIGSELGLSGDVLSLLSSNLKSDMKDDEIKNSLSQSKATLVKAGLPVVDTAQRQATNEEQLRKDAKDWVEQQLQKQKTE